jgi:hypothetical protein
VRSILVMAALLACAGCDPGPGHQSIPIGSRCTSNGQCGTTPFECASGYPGGYCDRACATDGDCPMDSLCINKACRRTCKTTSDCRAAEGYECRSLGGILPVCDLPTAQAPVSDMSTDG